MVVACHMRLINSGKIIMARMSTYGGIEVLNQLGDRYTHAGYR